MNRFLDCHTHDVDAGPDALIAVEPRDFSPRDGRFYALGIHPWSTADNDVDRQLALLQQLITHPQVVALGEVGLDRLRGAALDVQLDILRRQLGVAARLRPTLPLVIHNVRATAELMALRRQWAAQLPEPWIIHGFRGGPELARQLLNAGFHLSYGLRFNADTIAITPSERLHYETDDLPADTINDVVNAVNAYIEGT